MNHLKRFLLERVSPQLVLLELGRGNRPTAYVLAPRDRYKGDEDEKAGYTPH